MACCMAMLAMTFSAAMLGLTHSMVGSAQISSISGRAISPLIFLPASIPCFWWSCLSDGPNENISCSSKLQSKREHGRIAITLLGEREDKLLSSVCKDAIIRIAHGPWPFAGVRSLGMHMVCARIVEVQL